MAERAYSQRYLPEGSTDFSVVVYCDMPEGIHCEDTALAGAVVTFANDNVAGAKSAILYCLICHLSYTYILLQMCLQHVLSC